jgi:hypothetical protein
MVWRDHRLRSLGQSYEPSIDLLYRPPIKTLLTKAQVNCPSWEYSVYVITHHCLWASTGEGTCGLPVPSTPHPMRFCGL